MDEALIKRIPPHSIEAEKSVIGAMLMNKEAVLAAIEILTKEDFYQSQYGIIFESMKELNDEEKPVDAITLQEKLREKDLPPEVSGLDFVKDLVTSVPTSANVRHYAEIVKNKSTLRKLIRTADEIAGKCYEQKEETPDILDETEKSIFDVLQQRMHSEYTPIKEIVLSTVDKIDKASKTTSHVTGLATGYYDLDMKTTGLQNSDLILIAARPSMGKTALVLNIAANMAFHQKLPVALFSLEMSKEQLMNRLIAVEADIKAQNIRTGQLTDEEWKNLIKVSGIISRSEMIIDDTPGISFSELRSRARKYKLDHDIKAIFIDYLQLMVGSRNSDNRQQEVSEISRALKSLARELDIPIIALSQLNRSVEQREDHRPMLSDLRESGAIEQDADVVMFIYRDDYYHKDSEKTGETEIIIAKQRNGPIGTTTLAWVPELTKFRNIVHGKNFAPQE
ncbi:MAG: replicative DNA helicase [Lachnospiraceae bacterium]|jgi:replicative DNA helicase|nr:replicative DNA helicase [Lachnospiraceae bacterium]